MDTSERRFLGTEATAGVVLLAATAAALAWANSPWSGSYEDLWHGQARHIVNDRLMALFFLAVGLEIKRELVLGQLRRWRVAALPAIAAAGGMVVPALLFVGLVGPGAGRRGWAIPMATDIAFAVGVLAVVGRRAPASLRVFLLTLAVVDDVGAVAVVAVFYAGGIHAAVMAVAAGLVIPARGVWAPRLTAVLHPISAFVVVPLFALANAGVSVDVATLRAPGTGRLAVAVAVGLVVGKVVGITGASWIAVRSGVCRLPDSMRWRHVVGAGFVAGIGFTVSLFVTGLAFPSGDLGPAAKVGILTGSVVAAGLGALVLRTRHDG